MAHLGDTFDPNSVPVDDRADFEPLPPGEYRCHIIDSEMKATKSGGEMLKLTLEVIDGPHENRRIWDNLNIRNANPTAQSIAHQALAAILKAIGEGPITDSEVLHHRPFVAQLAIEADKSGQYPPRNAVKKYKALNGSAPAEKPAVRPAARPAAPPAAMAKARPWSNGGARQVAGDPPF